MRGDELCVDVWVCSDAMIVLVSMRIWAGLAEVATDRACCCGDMTVCGDVTACGDMTVCGDDVEVVWEMTAGDGWCMSCEVVD